MSDNNDFQQQLSMRSSISEPDLTTPESTTSSTQPSQEVAICDAPLLLSWKVSIGLSVVGIFLSMFLASAIRQQLTEDNLITLFYVIDKYGIQSLSPFGVSLLVWILLLVLYIVFGVIYAINIYPSLFQMNPKIKSNKVISFLNCFFGGIIFGLFWNHTLTRKKISNSYAAYLLLMAITVVFVIFRFSQSLYWGQILP